MSFPQFVDIAKYQGSTPSYFNELKRHGACGAFVQTNYGPWSTYDNPRAAAQIRNSLNKLKFTGCYDFFQDYPVSEASHFLNLLKSYGMDKSTPVMLDVEPGCGSGPQTHLINEWADRVHDAGFHNIWIYTMSSWILDNVVKPELLHHGKIWAAAYGTSEPGVNASAWQFTDNWHGLNTDGDYLFVPLSTMTGEPTKKTTKSKYKSKSQYLTNGSLFEALSPVNAYVDTEFKLKNGNQLAKGSKIHGHVIKIGPITRLSTPLGFLSANTDFIKKIKG